jgi:polysaccharide export outer membrane protein
MKFMKRFLRSVGFPSVALIGLLLQGCTFLPSNGPSLFRVKHSANRGTFKGSYVLIPINSKVLDVLNSQGADTQNPRYPIDLSAKSSVLQHLFRQGTPELLGGKPSDAVVQGDVVKVTIFDSGGSLFATPIMPNGLSQNGAIPHELPPQIVDNSGEIMVPYAGRIIARGRSVGEIQDEIQQKLKGKTVDPQVIVSIDERKGGDCVSILGDVKTPSRVPVSLAGTKLLDAIALAGGSTGKEYETIVTVTRKGTMRTALLSEIFENPSKNIFLEFGDSIIVRLRSQNYLCFGANNRLDEFPFNDDHLTLAKALAKVGGAADEKANPSAVLLYRVEPRDVVTAMGAKPVGNEATCPVIYRLDMTQADGFFKARNFSMRDHDILYTTTASSLGLQKFLGLIGSIFAPAAQAGGTVAGAAATAVAL